MTSYASQPTPERPAAGPVPSLPAAPPLRESAQAAPGREWHTGPHAQWHTAPQERVQDRPAEPRLGPTGEQAPAREQQAGKLRGQAPAREQQAGKLRGQAPGRQEPPGTGDERWAILSYLGVPFLSFLPPLAVYLIKLRTSHFARRHAAQALNLSITVFLYDICALILGTLLALDSVQVAMVIMVPLLAALWIVALIYLVVAGTAASRGDYYEIPAWLCAALVR